MGQESADTHLRSTEAVTGHHIQATGGEIGHLRDFIISDNVAAALQPMEKS